MMKPNDASHFGSECSAELGPALEDAAYKCLSALVGVDTHDMNLRDHPEAWAEIEVFAANVLAAERERCAMKLQVTRADVSLAAGELTAQEWRICAAVLRWMQGRIRG